MSTTTDAIEIIDHLQTDGISRETAKELIDYVDKQRGELATKQGQQWLTWIVGIGFTVMLAGMAALLTLMVYLHSDTKTEIDRRFTEMENRLNRIEQRNVERHKELKELLQRGQK